MFSTTSGGVFGVVAILLIAVFLGIGVFTTVDWLIGLTQNKNER